MDETFQKLWRSITVESVDEEKIAEYLNKQGMTFADDPGVRKVTFSFYSQIFVQRIFRQILPIWYKNGTQIWYGNGYKKMVPKFRTKMGTVGLPIFVRNFGTIICTHLCTHFCSKYLYQLFVHPPPV